MDVGADATVDADATVAIDDALAKRTPKNAIAPIKSATSAYTHQDQPPLAFAFAFAFAFDLLAFAFEFRGLTTGGVAE